MSVSSNPPGNLSPLPCAAFDADILERTPLFGGMGEEARCVLTDRMEIRPFSDATYAYREGDTARDLFILAFGDLEVIKAGQSLGHLHPGDFFGEASFLDMQPRGNSVFARGPCVVYALPYPALRSLYQVNVRMYALIVMNLARELSRRLRAADNLACGLSKPRS